MSDSGLGSPQRCRVAAFWFAAMLLACGSPSSPSKPIGEPCDPAVESECSDGLCVALDNVSGFCSLNCGEDAHCPDGYLCSPAGRYG